MKKDIGICYFPKLISRSVFNRINIDVKFTKAKI